MLEAINYWKRLKKRRLEDVGSCSAEIIRGIIPVTPLNTEQHYSDKDKYSGEPLYVVTVTKVEESSVLRGNESLARAVCSDTDLPLTRLVREDSERNNLSSSRITWIFANEAALPSCHLRDMTTRDGPARK